MGTGGSVLIGWGRMNKKWGSMCDVCNGKGWKRGRGVGYPEITMKLDDKGGERNFQLHNPFAVFLDFQSGIRGPLGDLTHRPSHSDIWCLGRQKTDAKIFLAFFH